LGREIGRDGKKELLEGGGNMQGGKRKKSSPIPKKRAVDHGEFIGKPKTMKKTQAAWEISGVVVRGVSESLKSSEEKKPPEVVGKESWGGTVLIQANLKAKKGD